MTGIVAFGPFRLDIKEKRLLQGNEPVRLEPKAFDILCVLVEHAGQLVEKDDLVFAVWNHRNVSDNSLTRCIHQLRAALGDDSDSPRFIETVPRSGYRFVAPVGSPTSPQANTGRPLSFRTPRALAAAGVTIALAIVATWLLTSANTSDDRRSQRLVVLPPVNLTGDPSIEPVVSMVHDALIMELSRVNGIDVVSRTTSLRYIDSRLSMAEIAAELGADSLIEGSVSRNDDGLALNLNLFQPEPEDRRWNGRFYQPQDDLLRFASEATREVVAELDFRPELSTTRPDAADRTIVPEAYEAYMLGRFHARQQTPAGYQEALRLFQQAIDLDPQFPDAYFAMAERFGAAAIFGQISPAYGFPRVRSLVEEALVIDDSFADAYMALAGVSFYWDWDWAEAERTALRAIELDPEFANSYRLLAEIYSATGRPMEAMAAVEKGRELDPFRPVSQFKPSMILYLQRDYEEAIERARVMVPFHPGFWQGPWLICLSRAALGHPAEAIADCEAAVQTSGRMPMALGALGYVSGLAGKRNEAEKILTELEERSASEYVGRASLAMVYAGLGDADSALAELALAFEDRDQLLPHVANWSFFDSLRAREEFARLTARIPAP